MRRVSRFANPHLLAFSPLLTILLLAAGCGTKTYRCPTSGMAPTLYVGDVFRARLNPYRDSSPARGDIVVFRVPAGAGSREKKEALKRIIGLSGEILEIRDFQVFIDGEALDEQYTQLPDADMQARLPSELKNTPPVQIPPDHYFVLGDNRANSVDSRHFGTVEIRAIVAKALVVVKSDHKGQQGKQLSI
jgi:signal peptidase I